jgi:hypothetical protein
MRGDSDGAVTVRLTRSWQETLTLVLLPVALVACVGAAVTWAALQQLKSYTHVCEGSPIRSIASSNTSSWRRRPLPTTSTAPWSPS